MSGRRTIARPATVTGVGLHLGRPCTLAFLPAAAGTGVRFRRTDLPGAPETPASVSVAIAAERRTQLGTGEGALHTVEHVLAAVAGLELDDLVIAMDAAEPPIMDGSAEPFRAALLATLLACALVGATGHVGGTMVHAPPAPGEGAVPSR